MNVSAGHSHSRQEQPRRFGDRFRATRVLKSSPAGETLRGVDTVDGREVVIRTMTNSDDAAAARLERELATLARLDGTDLVRPVAGGRQGSVLYSVTPYVAGVTLESCLGDRAEPLSVVEALAVGRGVLGALADAHDHGFLHGIALSAWAKASSGDVSAELIHGDLERLGEDVHTAAEVLQAEAVRLIGAGRPGDAAAVLGRAARMVKAKGAEAGVRRPHPAVAGHRPPTRGGVLPGVVAPAPQRPPPGAARCPPGQAGGPQLPQQPPPRPP